MSEIEQGVALTGRYRTGPPCNVGRPTADAPGPEAADRPRAGPACPPAALQTTDDDRWQTSAYKTILIITGRNSLYADNGTNCCGKLTTVWFSDQTPEDVHANTFVTVIGRRLSPARYDPLFHSRHNDRDKGKVLPYSSPNVGPGADPGVQAVSPQVTWSHPPGGRLPLLSARPAVTFP